MALQPLFRLGNLPATTKGGPRSLLAFWIGGACARGAAQARRGAWDYGDADPFFYEWWRKKQQEALAPPVPDEEIAQEPIREAVAQIGDVQTFNQLEDRTASVRADLLDVVRELRAEFLKMREEDEDDVETILMLL